MPLNNQPVPREPVINLDLPGLWQTYPTPADQITFSYLVVLQVQALQLIQPAAIKSVMSTLQG